MTVRTAVADDLVDRLAVSDLIDRYVVALDDAGEPEREDAWYLGIFSDDVALSFPIGDRIGVTGLAEFQRTARGTWHDTHHVSTNHVVTVDGDRATARAQVVATHVEHGADPMACPAGQLLQAGGVYRVGAVRTADGWRIDRLRFEVVWITGQGRPQTVG